MRGHLRLRPLFALLAMLVTAGAAEAQYTVNTTLDVGDGTCDTTCTLREAIEAANASAPPPPAPPVSVMIDIQATGIIELATALPEIFTEITIHGPGASLLTVRRLAGAPNFSIFTVKAPYPAQVVVDGLTISNGYGGIQGGGAILHTSSANVVVGECVVSGNHAFRGGAISNTGGGSVQIVGSTLGGNTGEDVGGALYNGSGGRIDVYVSSISGNRAQGSSFGGGIHNEGTLFVWNSTVSRNEAANGYGGGILNNGSATIISSTLSGNTAYGGGGVADLSTFLPEPGHESEHPTSLEIRNSTISGNFAEVGTGLLKADPETVGRFRSTIIAGNTPFSSGGAGGDLQGPFTSDGYNVIGDPSGAALSPTTSDRLGVAPAQLKLGPLQNNGGNLLTMALQCDSVAIDRGLDNTPPLVSDQRGPGFLRTVDDPAVPNAPGGDGTDAGAFELETPCFHGGPSTTVIEPLPAVQYSDVVTLRSHSTFDGGPITGVVHFLIDGELVGSSIVDETGIGMTDVTMNLTPGDYLVDAMFVSDVPEIDPGFATSILTVIPESATVTPMPGNPTSIQASAAGTASGGTGPICFAITEPADGSPGDTTFVSGNVQISGLSTSTLTLGAITFSEGGVGLARKACFPLALSNTPIGVYLIALNIEGTYIGFGTTSLSVIQSKADLLVSMSADKLNPKQGDRMTYTVAVTNFGPDTALNTVMNDALSSGTTFVSAKANKGTFTAPPAGQAGTVTWYLGDLANAGQEAAQIQVTVIVKGRTTITNTASVSSIASDPNPANNTASLTTSVAQGATKK